MMTMTCLTLFRPDCVGDKFPSATPGVESSANVLSVVGLAPHAVSVSRSGASAALGLHSGALIFVRVLRYTIWHLQRTLIVTFWQLLFSVSNLRASREEHWNTSHAGALVVQDSDTCEAANTDVVCNPDDSQTRRVTRR